MTSLLRRRTWDLSPRINRRRLSSGAVCYEFSLEETFAYDDNGNVTTDRARTLEWDGANRLTSVVTASQAVVDFTYDADGAWVRKAGAGGETLYRKRQAAPRGGLGHEGVETWRLPTGVGVNFHVYDYA